MSICPTCNYRVTNGADQTKRGGIRFHKHCSPSAYNSRQARRKRERMERNRMASDPVLYAKTYKVGVDKSSPFKRLYQALKDGSGLTRLLEFEKFYEKRKKDGGRKP